MFIFEATTCVGTLKFFVLVLQSDIVDTKSLLTFGQCCHTMMLTALLLYQVYVWDV